MAVAFTRGDNLGADDLKLIIADDLGVPFDPFYIAYSFYGKSENRAYGSVGGKPFLVGQGFRTPTRASEGVYYVGGSINMSFLVGAYYVEWVIRREENSPLEVIGRTEFAVYNLSTSY